MRYTDYFGVQQNLGIQPDLGLLPNYGYLSDLGIYGWSPTYLYANNEQGLWYDPSDLTTEKTSWRRNLLTYSQDFENAAWTKSNASLLSNLALYSQDFDNAAWGKTGATVTANTTTAPDGTTTADKLVEDTSTGQHRTLQAMTVSSGVAYAYSIYVKADTRSRISIFDNSSASDTECIFDLSNGTVVRQGAAATAIISSVGSGWYRCTTVSTPSVTTFSATARLVSTGTTSSYTGDGTSGLFIWGAQVNVGSTVQTYTRSLATAAPIQFADPLGGTQADKLVENTANAQHYVSVSISAVVQAGNRYTATLYAKSAERTRLLLNGRRLDGTFSSVTFDLTDGSVVSQANVVSASATSVGDGWYRLSYVYDALSGASAASFAAILVESGTTNVYTGDGVSGVYIFGAQIEQASTASAYQRITNFSGDFSAAFPNHSLYQESTGPSPVTALGQSVGLTLDRRLGGIGSPLVANGTFSDGTGWTFGSGWSLGNNIAAAIATTASATYAFTSVSGAVYRVQFDVMRDAGTLSVRIGSGTGVGVTTNGTHVLYVVGGASTTVGIEFYGSASFTGTLDNVIVQQVFGNHAIQATSASRPTLQARANLLTYSEQFDNAAWQKTNVTVTANAVVAPDGTTTADKIEATTAAATTLLQNVGVINATSVTFSFYGKQGSGATDANKFDVYNVTTASDLAVFNVNWSTGVVTVTLGAASTTSTDVGNGWWRITATVTTGITSGNSLRVYPAFIGGTETANEFSYLWGAQVEAASTASTYQRVVTATDYADVGLPRNLLFDGVDDSLATTGNVDFSATDKMSVFSGLTKASDAAQGIMAELTASTALNTGAFNVQAPSATPATNRYAFESKGSLLATANVTSATYAAPRTDVVTMTAAIGTDALEGRINGASVVTSATDQGTGNFASAVVYVGRRGGTTLPLNGRIFQLIIRGAATDSVTVINAEQYVAQKTGVTL